MKIECVAVVVFYHPTESNISNIDDYKDCIDKIYVVDNSDDDIIRIKNDKKIEYIKLYENLGIAKALNIGAKKAINDGYDYLLTMDQDSKISSSNIIAMLNFIEQNKNNLKIGLVSPYHNIKSGEDDRINNTYEEKIEVMTSGNIIDLKAYQEIGGFKDWLFIDCVDMDYGMNLNKHGYKVIRLNDVILEHELGKVKIHKLFNKEYPCYNHSPIRRYYMVRNTLYLKDMYYDLFKDHCDYLIRVQIGQVKRILVFEKDKYKKLKMMYKGYKDYQKGIKGKLII
ncbi:MAG: glycosyltransferase family 2 protein [Bacilli bacterium]|nr:glycosyltransferase family 2 protein [Bacilli bacterium]